MEAGEEHLARICAVDLNLGCPSHEIIRIGAGPALLKRRTRLKEMFEALAEWRLSKVLRIQAVGCKIRLGLNQLEMDSKVYIPVTELANASLDYIVVHARHAKQRSSEPPYWDAIAEVKAAATIPVIGNGNVDNAAGATAMRAATGCDGVMLARGAIANPWGLQAISGSGPDRWPSAAEVDEAEAEYVEGARRAGTKQKFVDFHAANFVRLRAVATGAAQPGMAASAEIRSG